MARSTAAGAAHRSSRRTMVVRATSDEDRRQEGNFFSRALQQLIRPAYDEYKTARETQSQARCAALRKALEEQSRLFEDLKQKRNQIEDVSSVEAEGAVQDQMPDNSQGLQYASSLTIRGTKSLLSLLQTAIPDATVEELRGYVYEEDTLRRTATIVLQEAVTLLATTPPHLDPTLSTFDCMTADLPAVSQTLTTAAAALEAARRSWKGSTISLARLKRVASSLAWLLDCKSANDVVSAMLLLDDEDTNGNPFLMLITTRASNFTKIGPMVLELDMAGELKLVGDNIFYEAADMDQTPGGDQRVQETAESIGDVAALLQSERLRRREGHSVAPLVELEGTWFLLYPKRPAGNFEVTETHRGFLVLPETDPQQAALRRVKLRRVCVGRFT